MERKTRIIAYYSQKGHDQYPEDTWDDECIVNNEEDLFEWMKRLHKNSARTFTSYPLGGLFSPDYINYDIQKIIIDDNGDIYYGPRIGTEPEIHKKAKIKYDEWFLYLTRRIPKLREARKKRLEEEKERRLFEELSKKFN